MPTKTGTGSNLGVAQSAIAKLCAGDQNGSFVIAAALHADDDSQLWGLKALVPRSCDAAKMERITAVEREYDVRIDFVYLPQPFQDGRNLGGDLIEISVVDGGSMEVAAKELAWLVQRFTVGEVVIVVGTERERFSRTSVTSGRNGSQTMTDALHKLRATAEANTPERAAARLAAHVEVLKRELRSLLEDLERDGVALAGLEFTPRQDYVNIRHRRRLRVALAKTEGESGP